MTFGAAALLGLALSAPQVPASPVTCAKYGVIAEKNDLAAEQDVAASATAGLQKAGVFDKASPCFVHVRITAGPIRTGGREDGWMAHVAASTRRLLKDGKHVTREKGMLFVEPTRERLVGRVRKFVEDYASSLGGPAPLGSDRG
jgi:hypothetical protein